MLRLTTAPGGNFENRDLAKLLEPSLKNNK